MLKTIWAEAKVYLIAFGLFLCVALGAGVTWMASKSRIAALEDALATSQVQVEALTLAGKARDAADKLRDSQRTVVQQQAKEDRNALEQAAARHQDWANQPVPDDVASVLRNAVQARPASAP
ncbi:Rz-like spanin [Ralstonia phage RSB3]|uniref:Uncharacterized protein n=1 Tax=Ralstonia phage RSB3 TaxID=1402875 RepID=U3TM49_9CAUD|nr:Rz-like spanin [Ralstonia phage RSB3]BAN92359.1 hypothetical protein [Ralstonia phage RSB3]